MIEPVNRAHFPRVPRHPKWTPPRPPSTVRATAPLRFILSDFRHTSIATLTETREGSSDVLDLAIEANGGRIPE